MRPRMPVLAALVTALGLGVVGCGQPSRTAPPAGESAARSSGAAMSAEEIQQQDAVTAWADGYCGAVSELVRSVSTMPQIDPSTPAQASRTSSELLGVMIGGLDRTLQRLGSLGRAPVTAAERMKADAVATYAGIRDRAVDAKQQLDAATTTEASTAAIGAVRRPLEEIGRLDLLAGFDAVPELRQASARAGRCLQLTEQGGTARFDPGR